MPFKINIGTKEGKTIKLEVEAPELDGKELGQKISGELISPNLTGYEFEIRGASDNTGFTSMENVEGIALKKELLTYGKAMHKRSRKEGKKHRMSLKPSGLRRRKTVRGKVISPAISQINLKLLKEGGKKLSEIFPEQFPLPETPIEEIPEDKVNPSIEPKTKTPSEDLANPNQEPKEKITEEKVHPEEEPKS